MKQYNIKVIPKEGGAIETKAFLGVDIAEAKQEASEQGFQVISQDKEIVEVVYGENSKPFFYSKKIKKKDVLLFFELFSNLDQLPIQKQVEILKKQAKKYIMKLFYDDLLMYIKKGKSLHQVIEMPKWSKFFTHNQIQLLAVGENTDNLIKTLKNLAVEQKNELTIRASLIAVSVYPLLILIAITSCSLIFFVYILPTLEVLTGGIKELPGLTQFLFDTRSFILNYGMISVIILSVIVVALYLSTRGEGGKYVLHKVLLYLPGIKQLLKSKSEMQISKILEFSSSAQMTPLEKVELLSHGVDNLVYKKYFIENTIKVERGDKLIDIFSDDTLFSAPLQGYIETGDLNKNLDVLMLAHYDTTLKLIQDNVKMITKILEVLVTFIMGAIVLVLAGGIFQLILTLTDGVA